jgi:hypothetical protein
MKKNIFLRVSLASALIVCLSAFSTQFSPLFASILPEGRTLDEAHDSGVIDWSGPASYISLWHRDSICPTGCNESVTRISNGGTVSGILAGDVTYFEVMVAATHNSSAGNAVLTACSASDTMNLYIGSGTGAPGLVSFPFTVPSGCTTWSLSASGGYVDFRSVDANYVSPPVLTDTPLPTAIPINTDTPLPTAIPINTDTPSPTATSTDTPSQTVTPTDTPTPTNTSTVTLTSPVLSSNTPTFTSTSTSGIQPHTPTPVVPTAIPQKTSTSSSDSVNYSNKSNSSVFSIHTSSTSSAVKTNSVLIQKPTSTVTRRSTTPVYKTNTVIPASNSATLALVCSSSSTTGGAGAAGSKLLGLLAAAGAAIGLGASAKTIQQTIAAWKQNGSGKSTIRVPHPCTRTTTVREWVSKTIKTIVEVFKYITRTIVEAIARFINRVRQVIDSITHSEWVTSTRRVLKTVFESVIEKVPVLKWLAKIVRYIYKTVIKPILKWITEIIRTLKTWVEKVIRSITERIQDGWNYITRTIVEKVKDFIEKSEIVGYWLTRTITVPDIEWVEIPVPAVVSNLLSTNTLKIIGELASTALLAGAAITACANTIAPTQSVDDVVETKTCELTLTAQAYTLSALAITPTLTSTPTATIELPCISIPFQDPEKLISSWGFGSNENSFNAEIITAAQTAGVPPRVLKGLLAVESVQFDPLSVSSAGAYGLSQITGNGMSVLFENNLQIASKEIKDAWSLMPNEDRSLFPTPLPSTDTEIQTWYTQLPSDYKKKINGFTLSSIDGKCTTADINTKRCPVENTYESAEIQKNLLYGALMLKISYDEVRSISEMSGVSWSSLPDEEKWEIAISNYNLSLGSGDYLSIAVQNCKNGFSWRCIYTDLVNNPATHLTAGYAEDALSYANLGCQK